jgi:hypothetical protein
MKGTDFFNEKKKSRDFCQYTYPIKLPFHTFQIHGVKI